MSRRPPMPSPAAFCFSMPIDVRFRDLDAMGHVNNAVYFTYFEIAREGYMGALGHVPPGETDATKLYPFILLDTSCRFLAPIPVRTRIRLHLRTASIGGKSHVFEYLITRDEDDVPLAFGHTTQVCYDYATGRTVPMSDELRARFEAFEGRSFPAVAPDGG